MRLRQLENQFVEIRAAQFAVQHNRASVSSAQAAVDLGRQSLDAEQKKYALGASTTTLVLQNRSALAQAESILVRGVVTLGHAMKLGFRALKFSANAALGEIPVNENGKKLEISGWMAAVNIIFSVGFFIFMYKFLPLVAATELKKVNPLFGEQIVFNLVDGIIRIALFLLFIWGVSLMKDIHRVYEYHGAEHKTVYAFENGDALRTGTVQKYSTYHPRCGTSFLMTVMIISILFYTVIPVTTFWARFGIRIALLPVIAGVSYEIFATRLKTADLCSR